MRTPSLLASFARDTAGVAAVEFALILPLMLLVYLGGVEAAQLYATDRKVATVAGTVADLVARTKGAITTAELDNYFAASMRILEPNETGGLEQIVSLVFVDEEGEATVKWSAVPEGVGEARVPDEDFPLDADSEISQLARDASGWLVVGEASYPYVPMTGLGITRTVNLRHVEYFLPRREDEITLSE